MQMEEEEEFLGFLETRLRFNQAAQKCMSCQTKIEGNYFGKANQRTSERASEAAQIKVNILTHGLIHTKCSHHNLDKIGSFNYVTIVHVEGSVYLPNWLNFHIKITLHKGFMGT